MRQQINIGDKVIFKGAGGYSATYYKENYGIKVGGVFSVEEVRPCGIIKVIGVVQAFFDDCWELEPDYWEIVG